MQSKKRRPSVIQLPGNVKFHAVVLQVVDRDPGGDPRTFRLLRDSESVELEGGEEFFVVYGIEALKRAAKEWN